MRSKNLKKPTTVKKPSLLKSASTLSVAISMCVTSMPTFSAALEEVIVTARKREENLQALPLAVTAMQADKLESSQISNIKNIQSVVPNVSITSTASTGSSRTLNAVMRGIGNEQGFAPGVGIYVDDVYLATASLAVLDVYDLERVEVLKGPQGNLYGRNTIGGAIRYITRDPSDETHLTVEGKVGSYDRREVKVSASGPLIDNLFYGGVAIARQTQSGTQKNIADGRHFDETDSWAGRASFKLTPTDNFYAKWVSDYYYDNSLPKLARRVSTSSNYAAGTPSDPTNNPDNIGKDEISFASTVPPNWYAKTLTHALTLNWDINDQWSAKSVSAYRSVQQALIQDLDGSQTFGLQTVQGRRNAARSQEFQFNYAGDGMDGVVGLYYFNEREPNHQTTTFFPPVAGPVAGTFYREAFTTSKTVSKAVYTSWDFDLSDDWHFTAGARQNWDHSDASFSQTELYPNFGNLFVNYGTKDFSKSWRKFAKTFRLSYDVSADSMIYAGYAEGYKQGGFNTNGGALAIALNKSSFNPETVKTYSLGFKTTQLDNSLRVNLEWFYNDYRDKLLSVIAANPVNPAALLQINENAGAVHTTGVDLDLTWSTPLDGLVVNGGIGYLTAVIDSYKASQWNSTGTGLVNPQLASAYRMGYSPRWTANFNPVYTLEFSDIGKLQVSATADYRAKSYIVSPTDTRQSYANSTISEERVLYNAIVSWSTPADQWRFALEGRNLSNERVLVDGFNIGATLFALGSYNEPRTWAASVRYKLQ